VCVGVGEVSVWEFSGYEPYHVTYDLFIGDCSCVSVIVVSLEHSADVQLSQIVFWLNFIKTRLAPQQTFGSHIIIIVIINIILIVLIIMSSSSSSSSSYHHPYHHDHDQHDQPETNPWCY